MASERGSIQQSRAARMFRYWWALNSSICALAEARCQPAPLRLAFGIARQLCHQFAIGRVFLKFLRQVHSKPPVMNGSQVRTSNCTDLVRERPLECARTRPTSNWNVGRLAGSPPMRVNRLWFLRCLLELSGGNYFDGYVARRRSTRIQRRTAVWPGSYWPRPAARVSEDRPGRIC